MNTAALLRIVCRGNFEAREKTYSRARQTLRYATSYRV